MLDGKPVMELHPIKGGVGIFLAGNLVLQKPGKALQYGPFGRINEYHSSHYDTLAFFIP